MIGGGFPSGEVICTFSPSTENIPKSTHLAGARDCPAVCLVLWELRGWGRGGPEKQACVPTAGRGGGARRQALCGSGRSGVGA